MMRSQELDELVTTLDAVQPPVDEDEPPPWDETHAELALRVLLAELGGERPAVRYTRWEENGAGRLQPTEAELCWPDGSSSLVRYSYGEWGCYLHEVAR